MACGPCAKKAAARKAALLKQQEMIQPLASGYVRKKYTGEPTNLLSVKDGMSYGFRNTGDVLVILEEDYLANTKVWADA
ncbi:MAG: hypothetical protein E6Q36_05305 [Chryseobacterium sp.]|nr:MAG: hypothetical protein E6Q36_05305 [Chryseobacterium sp.]